MAKKKSKTVKKTTTARNGKPAKRRTATESDRCQLLRDQLERLEKDIAEIEKDLAEPDLPKDLRKELERLLRQLIATRTRVLRALDACEKIPDDPRRKTRGIRYGARDTA